MTAKSKQRDRKPVTLSPVLQANLEELLGRIERTFSKVVEEEMRAMIREKGLDPDLPLAEFKRQLDEKGYRDAKSPPAHSKHRAA